MSAFRPGVIARLRSRILMVGVIPLFVLAHFGHHLLVALPIPLLPMIRSDFNLDYTGAGVVISAFSLAYGLGQLPAGWITDRIGPRIMITVGIAGVGVAGFLVGLSPSYLVLLVFMALMGLMGGGYHPAAAPMISAAVAPAKRGRALGFHVIGGSASYFLAPIVAAGIASVWGWQGAFIGLAVPAVLFGMAFYIVLGEITARKNAAATAAVPDEAPAEPGHRRRLVFFVIMSTFNQAVMGSVLAFVPLFMVDRFGVSKEMAAAFISLAYVPGLWAGPLGGYFSDRVGTVPMLLGVCFLTGPVIYLFGAASYGVAFGALLVLLGVAMYVRMPVSEAYIITHTSARNRSTILGIYLFAGGEGTGVLTPVVGYLTDRFGFNVAFGVAGAVVLLVTSLCAIWLWGRRR